MWELSGLATTTHNHLWPPDHHQKFNKSENNHSGLSPLTIVDEVLKSALHPQSIGLVYPRCVHVYECEDLSHKLTAKSDRILDPLDTNSSRHTTRHLHPGAPSISWSLHTPSGASCATCSLPQPDRKFEPAYATRSGPMLFWTNSMRCGSINYHSKNNFKAFQTSEWDETYYSTCHSTIFRHSEHSSEVILKIKRMNQGIRVEVIKDKFI